MEVKTMVLSFLNYKSVKLILSNMNNSLSKQVDDNKYNIWL